MNPPDHHPPPEPDAGASDAAALEAWLSTRRLRSPPAEWRETILRQATFSASQEVSCEADDRSRVHRERRDEHQGQPFLRTPTPSLADRALAYLTSGWSLTAAAWVIAFALNQYSIPSGAFTPSHPRPPFSEAALAEIRESQRALGDFANLGPSVPTRFTPPNSRPIPPESALPGTPSIPPGDRPRARLPRGFREGYVALPHAADHLEPELLS